MSARRSGSFVLSARDKSSNPLARYSLVRLFIHPALGLPALAFQIFESAKWFQGGIGRRAKLNAWQIFRIFVHVILSDHLIFWNKKLLMAFTRGPHIILHNGLSREKAARVAPSGLVDPTLCYPARGPASWRRRSEF